MICQSSVDFIEVCERFEILMKKYWIIIKKVSMFSCIDRNYEAHGNLIQDMNLYRISNFILMTTTTSIRLVINQCPNAYQSGYMCESIIL